MYRALETALARHGYYDASDLLAEAARLIAAEPGRLGAAAVLAFGFVELNPLETRLLDACGRAAPGPALSGGRGRGGPAGASVRSRSSRRPARSARCARSPARSSAHVEQGGRLDEVGILLRQPAAYLPAIRDVFAAAGIPTPGDGAGRSARHGQAGVCVSWPRRADRTLLGAAVMEFLAFADLRPRPGTSPAEWERLSRQAGVVGGAREWRDRLDRLGRRLAPPCPRRTTTRSGGPAARAIGTPSARFAGSSGSSCAGSPGFRIPRRWRRSSMPSRGRSAGSCETSPEAELALGALGRLRELGAVDAVVPLDEFWTLLEAALAAPSAAGSEPAAGRVFVGELGTGTRHRLRAHDRARPGRGRVPGRAAPGPHPARRGAPRADRASARGGGARARARALRPGRRLRRAPRAS